MSRCFPFPPPGYEKEAGTYDSDLLKKEKDKERKLKKEKKNREKKEGRGKEKKEKHRSERKHRDKREKKDKHRDKEQDRDKDKDRSTSDENGLPKQGELLSVDKASDEKKLLLPGRSEVNTGGLFSQKVKGRELDRNNLSGDKKTFRHFSGYSELASQNSHSAEPSKDLKLQQADIRDEVRGAGTEWVEKFTGADARNDEGMVRLVDKSSLTSSNGKEKIKIREDGKSDNQGAKNGIRFIGNATSQSFPAIVQPRIDKTLIYLDKKGDKRIEGKENSKKKQFDDSQGDKRKEKEVWEKDRDKEKKKEEKSKQKIQKKKAELDKLKETGRDDITGIYNAKASRIPEGSIKNHATEGNPKKRKELVTNGFLNANDIRPSKLSKRSSHPLTQNGKVSVTPSPVSLGWQGEVNKLQTDGEEHKINGVIESLASTTLPPSVPKNPLITNVKADPPTEFSRSLPHPDSKYLSEVLTVPQMHEWSDYDDQEWLFQGSDFQSKKPKVGTLEADEIPQVWSEALLLKSSGIYALPYVIPY